MAVISQKVDYEEEIFCLLRRPTFVTTKVGKIIFGAATCPNTITE